MGFYQNKKTNKETIMKLEEYAMAAMTALINTNDFLHIEEFKYKEVSKGDAHQYKSYKDGKIIISIKFSAEFPDADESRVRYYTDQDREVKIAKLSFKYAEAMMKEQKERVVTLSEKKPHSRLSMGDSIPEMQKKG